MVATKFKGLNDAENLYQTALKECRCLDCDGSYALVVKCIGILDYIDMGPS